MFGAPQADVFPQDFVAEASDENVQTDPPLIEQVTNFVSSSPT